MKLYINLIICFILFVCCTPLKETATDHKKEKSNITENNKTEKTMKLGAFSMSLSVKDLATSKTFYEKLGFTVFSGDMKMNYLIMKNESTLIGLFQGMFENNAMTFNPGWDQEGKNIDQFDDVRNIQKSLKSEGISVGEELDQSKSGPAFFMITDPDGNAILIDQHR